LSKSLEKKKVRPLRVLAKRLLKSEDYLETPKFKIRRPENIRVFTNIKPKSIHYQVYLKKCSRKKIMNTVISFLTYPIYPKIHSISSIFNKKLFFP